MELGLNVCSQNASQPSNVPMLSMLCPCSVQGNTQLNSLATNEN
jgi:hypothetical protein